MGIGSGAAFSLGKLTFDIFALTSRENSIWQEKERKGGPKKKGASERSLALASFTGIYRTIKQSEGDGLGWFGPRLSIRLARKFDNHKTTVVSYGIARITFLNEPAAKSERARRKEKFPVFVCGELVEEGGGWWAGGRWTR